MYNGIWYQAFLLAVFVALGMVCAFVFDTLRVSERFVRSNILVSVFKDILFWIITTALVFAICLRFNNGEIRFFMFAGVLFGALAYFNTVSKYVIKILVFAINIIKKIVFAVVFVPLRFLLKLINKPLFIAFSFSKTGIMKFCKKILFKFKVLKKFKR